MRSIFLEHALENVPRLLSLMDRNPASDSYGCLDRFFWHYKKADMPMSSIQSGVFSLALLYSHRLDNNGEGPNPYFGRKKVLEWVIAGIRYWCRLQNRDGSFDDYYPGEHSYIATSLGLLPVARAVILLRDDIPKPAMKQIKQTFDKACAFLSSRQEHGVMNQEASAACALFYANKILRRQNIDRAVRIKTDKVLRSQRKEGWFPEYEGFDVGYLSFHIDFFSLLYSETGDERILEALKNAIMFISHFFHPDGSCGGEYSARSTEFIIPSGFLRMKEHISMSKSIYAFIKESLSMGNGFSISVLDYRYLPIYMHQFIECAVLDHNGHNDGSKENKRRGRMPKLPFSKAGYELDLKDAGAYVKQTDGHYIIIGTKKGGVIKVFDVLKKRLIYSDCGYVFIQKAGRYAATAYYERKRKVNIFINTSSGTAERNVEVFGDYYLVNDIKPTVLKHIALRAINAAPFFSSLLREWIKHVMITKKRLMNRNFSRRIEFKKKSIIITDKVSMRGKGMLLDKLTFRYTPSAKYFNINELETRLKREAMGGKIVNIVKLE